MGKEYSIVDKEKEILNECKKVTSGFNYSFEKFKYINSKTKVTITCHEIDPITGKEHGNFDVRIDHLLKGSKCPRCSGRILSHDDFINHAEHVHGVGRYDYSLIKYNNRLEDSGVFICHEIDELTGKEHGEFVQKFSKHLKGRGCPKCAGNLLSNKEEFILKSRLVHGDRYTYDNFEYVNCKTPGWITCQVHGDFLQAPFVHLRGSGCPYCKNSTLEESLMATFDNNKIYYEKNVKYEGLGWQTIDFYLPQKHVYIECQGIQHYEPTKFSKKISDEQAENEYINRVKLDKEKYDAVTKDGNIMIYYTKISHYGYKAINPYVGWYFDKHVFTSKIELLDFISSLPDYDYTQKEKQIRRKKQESTRMHWTYEKCREEAKKYETRTEFEKGSMCAYQAARNNGWLDDFIEPIIKPKGYWQNKENILHAFNQCSTNEEFREKYVAAYYWARKYGLIKELTGFERKTNYYWCNKERVYEAARMAKNKKDFQESFRGAYNASVRDGYWHELMEEVFPDEPACGYWTIKEHVLDAAKQCTSARDMKKKFGGAYVAACRYGWNKELKYKE